MCARDCSDNCKDKSCMNNNGYCLECTPGKYGPFCTFDCLGKCKDNICQQIDGLCTGCKDGYFTDHCDRRCPSSCTTDVCDMITGYCTAPVQPTQPGSFNIAAAGIGITSGLVILTLVVLVIILVRRLSRYKRDNMNLTHMKDLSQSVRREDLQKNTEGTYDEIGSHTKTQPTETNRTDTNYEQLNALEREPSHVYETA
ncbi:multiple epidermal growth factor-like domains protein 10 [Mizuhopecten yessoensis]|uniref:multiple epidermal growth factor-like domains protein 10 n=1 Tax=Mizuhopecten yessoensis TaxID=6573 RepID=UPI000B457973|nr:multiple epidermal growth factor-like domains protein 10 [Mizuhopecten yessoensis]